MASDFWNENLGKIQQHFETISILFKNISDVESTIRIDFLKETESHNNQRP